MRPKFRLGSLPFRVPSILLLLFLAAAVFLRLRLLLFSREFNAKKMVRIQNECDRRMKEGADDGVLLCAVCPGDVQVH